MSTLLAILILHSVLLVALLLGHGRRADKANLMLAALIAAVTLLLVEAWLDWSGLTWKMPHLIGIFRPFWFLVGPCCYLYIRRLLGLDSKRWELALALPALTVFIYLMPFYMRSSAEKLTDLSFPGGSAGMLTVFLGFSVLTAGCAIAAARTVAAAADSNPPLPPPTWRSGWLKLLMWALAVYSSFDFAGTLYFILSGSYPAIASLGSLLVLVSLIYATGYLVIVPEGLLRRVASVVSSSNGGRLELPPGRLEYLAKKLDRLMAEERPWLDESLRLDDLAQRLGTSRHHLSQLLNQHLETTFRDYVNEQRVAEARRLLLDETWDGNVLAVGVAAGFGSNASLYRAFRRHVGCTPKQLVADHRQARLAEMG